MEDSATPVPSSIWASLNSWFTSTVFFVLLNVMIATIVFTSNLPNNNQQHDQQQQQEEEQQKPNSHYDRNQPQMARSPSILHRLKSFNFYPQNFQREFSHETHHHQEPLEVAATQFVFNQSLHYQHFDFDSTNSDLLDASADQFSSINQTRGIQLPDTETRVETVTAHCDFDPTRLETRRDTAFDFDPTSQETSGDTGFDFEPTRQEIRRDTGFNFDPADEEEHTDEFQSLDEVYRKLKGGWHVDRTKSDGELPRKPPTKIKKSASLKGGFSHLEEEEIVEARRPATVKERKSAVRVVEDDDVEVDSKADDFINKFKNDLKLQRIESIIRTKGATSRGIAK